MTTDLELEELARAASKGPYEGRDARGLKAPADCIDFAVISHATGKEVARVWALEDAHFFAAATPELILSLLAKLQTAEKALEDMKHEAISRSLGDKWT